MGRRREILQSQAANAVFTALGGAEARVYGTEPFQIMGCVHSKPYDSDVLTIVLRFVESVDGVNHTVEYHTTAEVSTNRLDLGPV